jgi:hypothetical protein
MEVRRMNEAALAISAILAIYVALVASIGLRYMLQINELRKRMDELEIDTLTMDSMRNSWRKKKGGETK